MNRPHSITLFLLQIHPSVLFCSFASQRIYGYVLSREQPNNITRTVFSYAKEVMK